MKKLSIKRKRWVNMKKNMVYVSLTVLTVFVCVGLYLVIMGLLVACGRAIVQVAPQIKCPLMLLRQGSDVIVGALLGAFLFPIIKTQSGRLLDMMPGRSLWRLKHPSSCTVVVSCHARYTWASPSRSVRRKQRPWQTWRLDAPDVPQGAMLYHYKNDTGEGQVRALTCLVASLYAAYGRQIKWEQLCFSSSLSDAKLDLKKIHDLILLGGPSTNEYTKAVLEGLPYHVSICSHGAQMGLSIKKKNCHKAYRFGLKYFYERNKPTVTAPLNRKNNIDICVRAERITLMDHAVIIRKTKRSEWNRGVIYVFAGCTTYGTHKAAEYFCNEFAYHPQMEKMRHRDYIAVIEIKREITSLENEEVSLVHVFDLNE